MRKLIILAVLIGVALAALPAAEAVPAHWCDTYCPTAPPGSTCLCPIWTDRPKATVFCSNWTHVGGCWYE